MAIRQREMSSDIQLCPKLKKVSDEQKMLILFVTDIAITGMFSIAV